LDRDKAAPGEIDCRFLLDDTLALFRAELRAKNITVNVGTNQQVNLQALTNGELASHRPPHQSIRYWCAPLSICWPTCIVPAVRSAG
jgi:hypothetical protein